jgi:hypothetical protein
MDHTRRKPIVHQLLDTLHATLPYFDQPQEALNRPYAPGKWTMREVLVHLSDTESVYLDRLRRLASEKHPTLAAFDENLWAANLHYKARDLNLARQQYEIARRQVIEMARIMDDSYDNHTGTHSEAGPQTFGQVINKPAAHNAHHLEQIKAIAEGRTWQKK